MLVPMAKVRILGHKAQLDETLAALQDLEVLQIENAAESSSVPLPAMTLDAGRLGHRESARFLLARLDALLGILPPVEASTAVRFEVPSTEEVFLATLQSELDAAAPNIQQIAQTRDALNREQISLPRYQATLAKLLPLTPELADFEGYETVALLLDRRYGQVLELLDQVLKGLTQQDHVIVSAAVDSETIGALTVFPRAISDEVHDLLGRERVTQVRMPPELTGMSIGQALTHIEQRLVKIRQELAAANLALAELSARWRGRWMTAAERLRARLAQLEIISQLSETRYTFVLTGWVPERALSRVNAALQERVGDTVVVEKLQLTRAECKQAPVLLENPGPARPFELFIRILALPQSGTLDPTRLMALFMPLFFGMMLGDVAYGGLLIGVSYVAEHRFRHSPTVRDLSRFLALGGGWAIVFGFLYGEFLGTLGHAVGLHPLWKGREDPETLPSLLVMTIALGAAHVVLGLLLGVWQAWRQKARHELWERAGLLFGLVAIFLLVAVATSRLPRGMMTPALAALVIGLVLLARAQWPTGLLMGPVEMLSTVGNVLSYLRIAAIGLSSVYLAQVGNRMAGLMGNLWLGIIVAGLFHALNLALGAFSPTIHSLRLHYVEFFGKFYQDGGVPFSPFGHHGQSAP